MTFKELLEYNFINIGDYHVNLLIIIGIILIALIARWSLLLLQKILQGVFSKRKIDRGRQFAVIQFLKYIVYTFALLSMLQTLGINLSLLWAGSAALLVGFGLGMQQTFNDLVSGIILLIEGTVAAEDIVIIDGMTGKVKEISIRTSRVETRDDITIIVPNSKLVTNNVVNWTHNNTPTRFNIRVGVSYSSDIDLVTNILLQTANEHTSVLQLPKPTVQFTEFGESSLDFLLYFYTNDFWRIEPIKSDIRYQIFRLFKEHNVEIPFPQRDLWIKNPIHTA